MPSQREWRERDAAKADQELLDRAAAWLRDDSKRRRVAGLWADPTEVTVCPVTPS